MADLSNRYDFVYLFDVQDGNPNGDPDAGNLPRMDPETGQGLVTDVCLKRKIRNRILIEKEGIEGYDIYVKERAVLGRAHVDAYKEAQISIGEEATKSIPADLRDELREAALPDGLSLQDDDENTVLVVAADADKAEVKKAVKELQLSKKATTFIQDVMKGAKTRKPTREEIDKGSAQMCKTFYDVRTFGAVMSLKSAPNCGQVRGPVQVTFSRSIDPIIPLEYTITRMAVAREEDEQKERTMGRKAAIPYGLYRCSGFVSPAFAKKTGFSEEDLNVLWESLERAFVDDASAARGLMSARKLYVFKHDSHLGNAPAHSLFDRIEVKKRDESKPARSFRDYEIIVNRDGMPRGVELIEKI